MKNLGARKRNHPPEEPLLEEKMREYQVDPNVRQIWKIYPIRIQGQSLSSCHGQPTLLVQSMEGGFVTRNCPTCAKSQTLPEASFLKEFDIWVVCPECKQRMNPDVVYKNYPFLCPRCDLYIKLAELLPRWDDL
jgi:endogenous inhibitor of DNA gyrase (YacG/DUF329 family)